MDSYDMSDKKKAIIKMTWDYLLKKGLAKASIGDLCKEANIARSSLYYWFDNQDDIWMSAGRYGLFKVADALFTFTLAHVNDIRKCFDTLLNEVEKYKHELQLAIQLTTCPVFGERMEKR